MRPLEGPWKQLTELNCPAAFTALTSGYVGRRHNWKCEVRNHPCCEPTPKDFDKCISTGRAGNIRACPMQLPMGVYLVAACLVLCNLSWFCNLEIAIALVQVWGGFAKSLGSQFQSFICASRFGPSDEPLFFLQMQWWYDRPGRPHMRHPKSAQAFSACFQWHRATVSCLVAVLGYAGLQGSLLTASKLLSSHCAGIGPDKMLLECFIKPALSEYGISSGLQHAFSLDSWSRSGILLYLLNSFGALVQCALCLPSSPVKSISGQ